MSTEDKLLGVFAGLIAFAICFLVFVAGDAFGQEHNMRDHAAGHGEYLQWSSKKVANCCNNQDCRGLSAAELRESASGPEILIDGQWCPVLREHYLTRGKSPDWNVSHACIRVTGEGCDRLLCYTGPGGV